MCENKLPPLNGSTELIGLLSVAEKQLKEGNILYNAITKIVRINYYRITINPIVPFNDFLHAVS